MASKSELYIPVKTVPLPGKTIQKIDGEANLVDCLFEDPEIKEFLLGVVEGSPSEDEGTTFPFVSLVRVSSYHGRSFELRFNGERTFPWEDEYGNLYTNFNLKGNDFRDLRLLKSDTAPSGYGIFGLQDSDALLRVIRASRSLRSQGIETEYINRVILPVSFPHKNEIVTPEEIKRRLLLKQMQTKDSGNAVVKSLLDFFAEEEGEDTEDVKVSKFLRNTEFVITLRSVQVSERLTDIKYAKTTKEFKQLMQTAFDYVNFTEVLKKDKDPEYEPVFYNSESKADIERFFTEYLPVKLGNIFAKMHNSGLVHRFPHPGNISLVGGIYDLDSVKGEPLNLGDEDIINEEVTRDVSEVCEGVSDIFDYIVSKKFLSVKKPDGTGYVGHTAAEILHQRFTVKFLETYLGHAEKKVDVLRIASGLLKLWVMPINSAAELLDTVFALGKLPSLDFRFTENTAELFEKYYQAFAIGASRFMDGLKIKFGSLSKDDTWAAIMYFTSTKFTVEQFLNEYGLSILSERFDFSLLEAEYGGVSVATYQRFLAYKEAKRIMSLIETEKISAPFHPEIINELIEKYSEDKPSVGLSSAFKIGLRR